MSGMLVVMGGVLKMGHCCPMESVGIYWNMLQVCLCFV